MALFVFSFSSHYVSCYCIVWERYSLGHAPQTLVLWVPNPEPEIPN